MLNGMNIYVIAGIIFIILVILYVIYLLFFTTSTSFEGVKDLQLLTDKPLNGNVQYRGDLQGYGSNINNSMSMGFVLYLVSPESNIGNRRNIFSIYDKKVVTPTPGSNTCQTDINNYITPGDAGEFPGVYLDADGSTIQFVFKMSDGSTQIATYENIPYNKICVLNIFMGDKHIDIYLDGELAKTHQFTKSLDYRSIKKSSANLITGFCGGFSGYLYNIAMWSRFLRKEQIQEFVAHCKKGYETAAKSSNITGNEVIPCAN
jgi:hypothetical protein